MRPCARVQVRSRCVVLACACCAARRQVARGSTRRRTCLDACMCKRASAQHALRAQLISARVRKPKDFVRASGHHASLTAKCSSAPRALADHRLARILPPARRGVSASSRLQLVTGEEALLPRKRNADSAKKMVPDKKQKQLEFSRVVIRGRFSTQI